MVNNDAYILIGGRSSRLGRDKAAITLVGETLAQRAHKTVTKALPKSRVTFVAGYEAQFAIDAIAAGGRFIFDLITDRGPLGGLHSALSDAQTPWIFALACDYPFVTPELIRLLSERISDEVGAILPEQADGRLQPLCAFYKVEAATPVVQQIIDRPRVPPPLHEIIASMRPRIVQSSEWLHISCSDLFFINVNSAADLDLALFLAKRSSGGNGEIC